MLRFILALACATALHSQVTPSPASRPDFANILSFEMEHEGNFPKGWNGGPRNTIVVDSETVHGGRWSVRIDRTADSAEKFTAFNVGIPLDFAGKSIELRGFLKTENVSEYTGLWMREDGDTPTLAFDNMQARQLKGTTDWTEYSIVLPLHRDATRLIFGVLLVGTGKTWADDLRLLVDGKPVWEAPKSERPKTILDTDKEFDKGSRMTFTELSSNQIRNLAMLGKVWGFLKYHHPRITSGKHHFDYELFRVVPGVLAAVDRTAASAAINKWVAGLGAVDPCNPCAKLNDTEIHLRPQLAWLADKELLGSELSQTLQSIFAARPQLGKQFYVSLNTGVGNPSFDHELAYATPPYPDAGFRLLAVYRFWNIIEYWFPYRDVLSDKWDTVLSEFIPRVSLAKDSQTYQQELMALIAKVHDTHANLWSSMTSRPPVGACQIPVSIRFVENDAVVARTPDAETGMKAGDVILALDGVAVTDLVNRWRPYYAASNEPTRLRDMGRYMTRGDCGDARVRIRRDGESLELTAKRIPPPQTPQANWHDLPGETFRRLSDDVAYLKLSSVQIDKAASYIDSAAGAKGLIIDIRNYPSAFVVFALGSLLVDKETEFTRFTNGDLSNPGAFHWTKPLTLRPGKARFNGKIMILVDEVSQSQSEYTTMAFRSAPQAKVIGSTTAGADGNVSNISLPGGLRSMISGIGVFYPDKKPTQRIGIIPDIERKPTISGIKAGRDEVLEEALRQILGPETPAATIEKLAKP